ncbi:MAG: DUF72 domain-containing protein [Actinomycetota bacterium]|nr:DUF72 domain-containing protein [Actinomycetota bacterium]
MSKPKFYIGTSGFHYLHWVGPFYPPCAKPDEFLSHYASFFDTLEINNSFYRLPEEKTLVEWREKVSPDFVFSVKASRYITHMKKLKEVGEPLGNFIRRVGTLGEKLGPILFQLPPRWKVDVERLESFLEELPRGRGRGYAFEFRDTSWFHPGVYQALERFGCSFCIYELSGVRSPNVLTADFAYVRLHGPGGAYEGKYTKKALSGWAEIFSGWVEEGRDVYCYFDNDQFGYAVENAIELKSMLE